MRKILELNKKRNVISFWGWLRIKTDYLPAVTFIFVSRVNATNMRIYNLALYSAQVRVVLFKGTRFRGTDLIVMKLMIMCLFLYKSRISSYKALILTSLPNFAIKTPRQYLHIDDPKYSQEEYNRINDWIISGQKYGTKKGLILTSQYTSSQYKENCPNVDTIIISQGYTRVQNKIRKSTKDFICVYASPYLHYGDDKLSKHSTWGAQSLIDDILPLSLVLPKDIKFIFIANIGKCAKAKLLTFPNVRTIDYLEIAEYSEFLKQCSVGIYPRTHDHKRRILKIFDYVGAGIPIVTYRLEDTKDVDDYNLGISVTNPKAFIDAIRSLFFDSSLYEKFAKNVREFSEGKDWESLTRELENRILP
jgi:hypothetical protein